jgi:putative DNA primase/helicase
VTLRENHLIDLRASGLDDNTIELARFRSGSQAEVTRWLRFDAGCGGLLIPYLHTNGTRPPFVRVKPDRPFTDKEGRVAKYLSPRKAGNHLYIPPTYTDELQDASIPVIITEGEKKALKGAQELTGYVVLALPGVWCFRNKDKTLIKDFGRIRWDGRLVYIAYDSDLAQKPEVQQAENGLAEALFHLHPLVRLCRIPAAADGSKQGLDDYLIAHSAEDFEREVLFEATAWQRELILDPGDPLPAARKYVAAHWTIEGIRSLQHQLDVFYSYDPQTNAYSERDAGTQRADLYRFLEAARCRTDDGLMPFKPTPQRVGSVIDALRAVCNLPARWSPPCWVNTASDVDPLDLLACTNGLLHIPQRELLPATAAFFTLNGLAFDYRPQAEQPGAWFTFLDELWAADTEQIETLQEWLGYLLTARMHMQKILMIVGPPRSGKGTIANVVEALLGAGNVCKPTLANLGREFGRSKLIGKTAAIISDARISSKSDTAVITETLLSISGEDSPDIPRKYLSDWSGKLRVRFVILTNELPRIEDMSGALASRFIILKLTRSFLGHENPTLFERKLKPEIAGILNWALDGWARLNGRGHFRQPRAGGALVRELDELGSPIRVFIRDRLEKGSGYTVEVDRAFAEWRNWCLLANREHPGTVQSFSRNMHAALSWLKVARPRDPESGKQTRVFQGLRLRPKSSYEEEL